MRRGTLVVAALLAAGTGTAPVLAAVRPRPPAPISITVAPGQVAAVQQALGRSALRVVRRNGRDLQVIASRTRIPLLRAIPGVAAASLAPSS